MSDKEQNKDRDAVLSAMLKKPPNPKTSGPDSPKKGKSSQKKKT